MHNEDLQVRVQGVMEKIKMTKNKAEKIIEANNQLLEKFENAVIKMEGQESYINTQAIELQLVKEQQVLRDHYYPKIAEIEDQ